jgi:hypothetical protein
MGAARASKDCKDNKDCKDEETALEESLLSLQSLESLLRAFAGAKKGARDIRHAP